MNSNEPHGPVVAAVVPDLGYGGHLGLRLHLHLVVLVLEVDVLQVWWRDELKQIFNLKDFKNLKKNDIRFQFDIPIVMFCFNTILALLQSWKNYREMPER